MGIITIAAFRIYVNLIYSAMQFRFISFKQILHSSDSAHPWYNISEWIVALVPYRSLKRKIWKLTNVSCKEEHAAFIILISDQTHVCHLHLVSLTLTVITLVPALMPQSPPTERIIACCQVLDWRRGWCMIPTRWSTEGWIVYTWIKFWKP